MHSSAFARVFQQETGRRQSLEEVWRLIISLAAMWATLSVLLAEQSRLWILAGSPRLVLGGLAKKVSCQLYTGLQQDKKPAVIG